MPSQNDHVDHVEHLEVITHEFHSDIAQPQLVLSQQSHQLGAAINAQHQSNSSQPQLVLSQQSHQLGVAISEDRTSRQEVAGGSHRVAETLPS